MSIRVMSQIWESSSLGGTELLLLLAIGDFSSDEGLAYPSVPTLAAKIRMSERNTHYLIKKLERSGELDVQRNKGPKGCNLFRVQILQGASSALVQPMAQGGATGSVKGVQPIAPEPSLNHQEPSIYSRGGEIANAEKQKPKRRREMDTLRSFIDCCKVEESKPIPIDDPIFGYAEQVGLTGQMIALAWTRFKQQYLAGSKTQKDWRAHFRNAVRSNWYKLWYFTNDGTAALTTAGVQAQREQDAIAMERAT